MLGRRTRGKLRRAPSRPETLAAERASCTVFPHAVPDVSCAAGLHPEPLHVHTFSAMSIQLTQLLELSHELCHARKRRCEWETHAEGVLRRRKDANTPPPPGPAATLRSALDGSGDDVRADIAEMHLLCESLRSQGLSPRAPDAEHAYARLLSAVKRPSRSDTASFEGSDFEWMIDGGDDSDVVAPRAGCAATGPRSLSRVSFGDQRANRLTSSGSGDDSSETAEMIFACHSEAADARECRLTNALHRLSSLLRSTASAAPVLESADSEDDDSEEDEEAAALALIEETSREAMIEAERHELSQMLVSSALDMAAAIPAVEV